MKKRILSMIVLVCLLFSGCAPTVTVSKEEYEQMTNDFVTKLTAGQYADCVAQFTAKTKEALPEDTLKDTWEMTIKNGGAFQSINKIDVNQRNGKQVGTAYCEFEKNGITVQITYESDNEISGLWFNYYEPEILKKAMPPELTETELTIGEGTEWPLPAKLTTKTGAKAKTAAILVHGSGASDMDETVFSNRPFRDIAWGLAQQGVDVLRYDKRSLAYAEKLNGTALQTFTVKEETIEDAILAGKLLQEQGYEKIYLIGHSLGGMLAPRIEQESGDLFAGLVLLAGSPRTLTELMVHQNEAAIAAMTDETRAAESTRVVEEEKNKLAKLESWNAADISKNTVFGIPAYYLKELLSYDTAELAKKVDKPILVLQGSKDFQVYADKDFVMWKEILSGNPKAEFALYDNLNHLFMPSQAGTIGTVEEYQVPGLVDQRVIDDIAKFIAK